MCGVVTPGAPIRGRIVDDRGVRPGGEGTLLVGEGGGRAVTLDNGPLFGTEETRCRGGERGTGVIRGSPGGRRIRGGPGSV